MATIVLSAVGAAAGASIGGSALGLSSVVIGRAVGATIGRVIDQRILGSGSPAVETPRIERFRLNSASEGSAISQVFGRTRTGGQVIWASRFQERASTSGGGGKGAPSTPRTTTYSYSVSIAIALCEGEISRVARIWADGAEIAADEMNIRVYAGGEDQFPDPKIEAVEGAGFAPSYRGIAYVVIEDLELARFGNRVPQFSFEVVRPEPAGLSAMPDVSRAVRGVALMPGTGEYSLATTPVHFSDGPGINRSSNVNSPSGGTDFTASLRALNEEMPACTAVSLVVSWFGSDLRCGECHCQPKVEQNLQDGVGMKWSVSGIVRSQASVVPQVSGRPIYGGTPTDRSVREAIAAMSAAGKEVMFYPFLLMDQVAGNGLPDPWSDATDQPKLPWRGRITTSKAPGQAGSTDGSIAAETEVEAFFGSAAPADFTVTPDGVDYSGPAENSYRRFILHYAHLCASAGGVEAFCIGSEMRSLTQIRGVGNAFVAVDALKRLATDVRAIVGPSVKIGYAADWSEYFGYHPQDGSGDVYFHLDPLWAHADIDFVGIDNYMPLSDWRDGQSHADSDWGSIYNLDYLSSNIAGGEGFDWYYHAPGAEAIQLRTPISDGAYGEPWVFRYKDIASWWSEYHHNRPGGVRQSSPTAWQPESKPIRFTEFGCPAVDKGTNQPNKFQDPKSSESALPKYSSGRRDDLVQLQYLRATVAHWSDPQNNPVSNAYGGSMVDIDHSYAWAWDARPFPHFPANRDLWSDGENYAKGHWLTGRVTTRSLASVVAELCERAGLLDYDVSQLFGIVRGYEPGDTQDARSALQPLMVAYGFDAFERGGQVLFRSRVATAATSLHADELATTPDLPGDLELLRASAEDVVARVRLSHPEAEGNYDIRVAEAATPDRSVTSIAHSELPIVLTRTEARQIVERWVAETRVARDRARFALPPGRISLGAGDIVELANAGRFRIDSVEDGGVRKIEASRVEPGLYDVPDTDDEPAPVRPFVAPLPVEPVFLDLPLLIGDEDPVAPYIAVTATPWTGAALYSSSTQDGFELNRLIENAATIGDTENELIAAKVGVWDRGAALRVHLFGGSLSSATASAVLAGANSMAIGSGASDNWEVFQFADAQLVATDTFELSLRLRGQVGTDSLMPATWPIGSRVVLLDSSLQQIDLPGAYRGLARYYRIGPSRRPVDDATYQEVQRAFEGKGLRPYAPVHVSARRSFPSGTLTVRWIRRTRIDGDIWSTADVALGEASERFIVRVIHGGTIRRETEVSAPTWDYSAAEQASDGVTGPFSVDVAQISDRFGPGLFRRISVNG